jgi:AraC-like DNA-binding protein
MTVEEAADSGGFSDRSHFSRLFSRHHGVNPGHYRRLAQARGAPEPQIDPGPHTPT